MEPGGRSSLSGDSERKVKEGSGYGASLYMKPGEGFLYWGQRGFWMGRSFIGDSERHVKEDYGNGTYLSLLRLCDRNWKGQLLY